MIRKFGTKERLVMNKGCMGKENSYPNTFATEQLSFLY